jgi:hypothetical protein
MEDSKQDKLFGEEPKKLIFEFRKPEPRDFSEADRAYLIGEAVDYTASALKGRRTENWQDFAMKRSGYDRDTIQKNMDYNFSQAAIKLGSACLRCKFHRDGSCSIDNDYDAWLAKYDKDSSQTVKKLRKLHTDIQKNPDTRC